MKSWKTIKKIKTLDPSFFMRSHDNTAYAWVDVFFGPDKGAIHLINKQTLEIVKILRPEPDKIAAIVIYDATTFEEIKRIPMNKPVGKYNVYNKISYSRGTSH